MDMAVREDQTESIESPAVASHDASPEDLAVAAELSGENAWLRPAPGVSKRLVYGLAALLAFGAWHPIFLPGYVGVELTYPNMSWALFQMGYDTISAPRIVMTFPLIGAILLYLANAYFTDGKRSIMMILIGVTVVLPIVLFPWIGEVYSDVAARQAAQTAQNASAQRAPAQPVEEPGFFDKVTAMARLAWEMTPYMMRMLGWALLLGAATALIYLPTQVGRPRLPRFRFKPRKLGQRDPEPMRLHFLPPLRLVTFALGIAGAVLYVISLIWPAKGIGVELAAIARYLPDTLNWSTANLALYSGATTAAIILAGLAIAALCGSYLLADRQHALARWTVRFAVLAAILHVCAGVFLLTHTIEAANPHRGWSGLVAGGLGLKFALTIVLMAGIGGLGLADLLIKSAPAEKPASA